MKKKTFFLAFIVVNPIFALTNTRIFRVFEYESSMSKNTRKILETRKFSGSNVCSRLSLDSVHFRQTWNGL